MENTSIFLRQRFNSFSKAFSRLTKYIDMGKDLSELEQQGLVHAFEYNFDLSGLLLKAYYESQGKAGMRGSRDAFKMACNDGLLKNETEWMRMVDSRIMAADAWTDEEAHEIVAAISNTYYLLFTSLYRTMDGIVSGKE